MRNITDFISFMGTSAQSALNMYCFIFSIIIVTFHLYQSGHSQSRDLRDNRIATPGSFQVENIIGRLSKV